MSAPRSATGTQPVACLRRSLRRLEEHHVHPPHRVGISEPIDELADAAGVAGAEHGLQTPVAVVEVLRRADDVLVLELDGVQVADDERVLVVERQCGDVVAFDALEGVWRSTYSRIVPRTARERDSIPCSCHRRVRS